MEPKRNKTDSYEDMKSKLILNDNKLTILQKKLKINEFDIIRIICLLLSENVCKTMKNFIWKENQETIACDIDCQNKVHHYICFPKSYISMKDEDILYCWERKIGEKFQ